MNSEGFNIVRCANCGMSKNNKVNKMAQTRKQWQKGRNKFEQDAKTALATALSNSHGVTENPDGSISTNRFTGNGLTVTPQYVKGGSAFQRATPASRLSMLTGNTDKDKFIAGRESTQSARSGAVRRGRSQAMGRVMAARSARRLDDKITRGMTPVDRGNYYLRKNASDNKLALLQQRVKINTTPALSRLRPNDSKRGNNVVSEKKEIPWKYFDNSLGQPNAMRQRGDQREEFIDPVYDENNTIATPGFWRSVVAKPISEIPNKGMPKELTKDELDLQYKFLKYKTFKNNLAADNNNREKRKLAVLDPPDIATTSPPATTPPSTTPWIGAPTKTTPRAPIYSNPALIKAQDAGTNFWKGVGQTSINALDASPIGSLQRGLDSTARYGVNKLKDLRDLSTNYSTRQIQAERTLQQPINNASDKYANFTGGEDVNSISLDKQMVKDVQAAGSRENALSLLATTKSKLAQRRIMQYINEAYSKLL